MSELARDVSRRFCLIATDLRAQRRNDELVVADRLLSEANARLAEALRNKDDFMAVLSHELRNPLTPIRNSLYILHRVAPASVAAVKAFEVIERQVEQLTRLVDDLLDVTRIASGKVHLQRERVDLNELVARTVEDHHSLFDRRGVSFTTTLANAPVMLDADAARIAQVVGNLLANAAKFTARGGSATITVERDDATRQAIFWVSDTGAGLSPATLANLFKPLFQADRTLDRSQGGLGLGLALVRALVELHGGEVSASSAGLGQGAAFVVRLPLEVEPAHATPQPAVAPGTVRRVLVIDDNVDLANSLQEAMALCGHLVEVAYDGAAGLSTAREFKPDVVLCDIGLPGMSGYEVAHAFRADEALAHAHLIAVSGYAMLEDIERSKAAGFELHLAKPTSIAAIDTAIVKVIGSSHSGGPGAERR